MYGREQVFHYLERVINYNNNDVCSKYDDNERKSNDTFKINNAVYSFPHSGVHV